jgi:Uma2 family endonuclease
MTALKKSPKAAAKAAATPARKPRVVGVRKMSLQSFINWKPADGWKYDWDNGTATRSVKMTSKEQRYIVRNLQDAFTEDAVLRKQGYLIAEPETHTKPGLQIRVPDIAYYPRSFDKAPAAQQHLLPPFLIEIISHHDSFLSYSRKLAEYFSAGAKVVWLIDPEAAQVHVYTSPVKLKIMAGKDLCSAKPAVDFSISVDAILKL